LVGGKEIYETPSRVIQEEVQCFMGSRLIRNGFS